MKKKYMLIPLIMLVSLSLTACGGESESVSVGNYDVQSSMMAASPEMAMTDEFALAETKSYNADVVDNRKLIKTASYSVETKDLKAFDQILLEEVDKVNGYVERRNLSNDYSVNASYTLRIPTSDLSTINIWLSENSNVISQTENIEDVTIDYIDVEAYKKSLETEYKRLLELMERAETVEDIITIESRLSNVRYQMENYTSQLRALDNQIEYSAIDLYVEEVEIETITDVGFAEKIKLGFMEDLHSVGKFLENLVLYILTHLPSILLSLTIIGIFVLIIKLIVNRGNKKSRKSAVEQIKEDIKSETVYSTKTVETVYEKNKEDVGDDSVKNNKEV